MSKTQSARFGDLLAYPLRSGVTVPKSQRGTGIKMINMGELFRYPQLGDVDMALVDIALADRERYLVQAGDLLFARRSLTVEGAGQCAIVVDAPVETTWESSIIRARLDRALADPHYYFYFFRSPQGRTVVEGIVEQVAAAGIRSRDLSNLPVPSPAVAEQRAVAGVLRALDDKIAVNERILVAADELMRALYDNSCSRASKFITIGELGRLVRDGVPASSLTGREHYIGLEHMPRRNMWLAAWEDDAELASGKSAFCPDDVLFGKLRPYFHKVGLALTSGVCSMDILVIRPVEPARLGWLLLVLSSDEVVAHASAVGDGTRMPRTKWRDLESYVVPWPGDAASAQLNATVRSLAARIQASVTESRTLAALRDTLLPQLMSGRLRVKDAEKIVEANT